VISLVIRGGAIYRPGGRESRPAAEERRVLPPPSAGRVETGLPRGRAPALDRGASSPGPQPDRAGLRPRPAAAGPVVPPRALRGAALSPRWSADA